MQCNRGCARMHCLLVRPMVILTTSIEFERFKVKVDSIPRGTGYYLISLIDIEKSEQGSPLSDSVIDEIMELFDDQKWPSVNEHTSYQKWADYETEQEKAMSCIINALVGGPEYGWLKPFISITDATKIWVEFDSLIPQPKRYYTCMGLGDPKFVFLEGCVIIGKSQAVSLCLVFSD